MKLKNIITESLIDNLSIPKPKKQLLSLIDKLYRFDTKSDGSVFLELKDIFSFLSNQEIFNLIHFYKEYGDILFNDVTTNLEDDKDLDIKIFPEVYLVIMLKYIEDNYSGKSIYKTEKLDYVLDFFEPIEDMIEEEMDGFLLYDSNTSSSVFIGIMPTERGIGYDFLIQDDDFYDYFGKDEIIQSGYMPVPKVKNILSEEGLKNSVDYILNYLVNNVIQPNEVSLNEISDIRN